MTKIRNVLKADAAILKCPKQIVKCFGYLNFGHSNLFRASIFGFRIYDTTFGSSAITGLMQAIHGRQHQMLFL